MLSCRGYFRKCGYTCGIIERGTEYSKKAHLRIFAVVTSNLGHLEHYTSPKHYVGLAIFVQKKEFNFSKRTLLGVNTQK